MNFTSGLSSDNQLYDETLEWLYAQLPMFSRIGAAAYKPGLDNTLALDSLFEHPHRKFRSIHVAGTNGKGSTSHNLAAILQAQGYKTGLYTSPHLVDFRERIRINGTMIPHAEVISFVERWKRMQTDLRPSFFELTMMMAFDWFAKEEVDYAVIETGMGGRLDSTNIISPLLCVITNISLDHTQFLGITLPLITVEKAGIIKKGVPVVVGEADGEVRKIFETRAVETDAPIIFAEDDPAIISAEHDSEGEWKIESVFGSLESPLGGDYQLKNLNTVLTSVRSLRDGIITISDEAVRTGLRDVVSLTGLAGRWMIAGRNPLMICDTGHNIAGLSYNFAQLERLLSERPGRNLHIVLGFVADKAIDEILTLLPESAKYYATQASIPRALEVEKLSGKLSAKGIPHTSFKNVKDAVRAAVSAATPDDILYIGGSTFVVADYLNNPA